jgi:hypothetical protein
MPEAINFNFIAVGDCREILKTESHGFTRVSFDVIISDLSKLDLIVGSTDHRIAFPKLIAGAQAVIARAALWREVSRRWLYDAQLVSNAWSRPPQSEDFAFVRAMLLFQIAGGQCSCPGLLLFQMKVWN